MRLAGEFVAISAGVLVALVADDWRQNRVESQEVRESLRLVIADLREDSTQFVVAGRTATRQAGAAAWLVENWDRIDLPEDSLEVAMYQFSSGTRFRPRRFAYEGLRDLNRLRLLETDSLRLAVTAYYQDFQEEVIRYDNLSGQFTEELNDEILASHVRHLEGETPGSLWPPIERRVDLRHSWAEIARDTRLHSRIVMLGRFEQYLASLYAQGEAEAGFLIGLLGTVAQDQ